MRKHIDTDSLIGKMFGFLTVTGRDPNSDRGAHRLICKCNCGNTKTIPKTCLLSGDTVSCGCYRYKQMMAALVTHGCSHTGTYNSWSNMKQRCLNKNHLDYHYYGRRGITVCAEWMSFDSFLVDMGEKTDNALTIERHDNLLGYYKENCYWATRRIQMNNTRKTKLFEHNGMIKSIQQWSEYSGIKYYTLRQRLMEMGWSIEKAITTPSVKYRKTQKSIVNNTTYKPINRNENA